MSKMLALVGEQPMPVLLPVKYIKPDKLYLLCTTTTEKVAKHLKSMIPNSECMIIYDAYDIVELEKEISSNFQVDDSWIFNITGATKPMVIAAYNIARSHGISTIYFQSEGKKALLYEYYFREQNLYKKEKTPVELPELITVDDYIRAHLGDYVVNGPHKDEKGIIDAGGKFEELISHVLQKYKIDTLCGVRPNVPNSQIEFDLIMRVKNNVGVAECKLSSGGEERQKRALEQLAFETQREYFGTYTEKFLITGGRIDNRLSKFASDQKYRIIELSSYKNETLSAEDEQLLINTVKKYLSPEYP